MNSEILRKKIKKGLYDFLPYIMNIADISDKQLDKKISSYIKRCSLYSDEVCMSRPDSIFRYILEAQNGSMRCLDFLSYIDSEINKLFDLCKKETSKKHKIKSKAKKVIIDFDERTNIDHPNPSFMNSLTELLFASYIIPKASEKYDFIGFDVKLKNNKDADLVFRRKEDDQIIYFDNLSIHYIDIEKITSAKDFKEFLIHKINEKLVYKTSELQPNKSDDKKSVPLEFYIIPFLWSETSEMLPYKEVFNELIQSKNLSYYFLALFPQVTSDGHYVYTIQSVENILERWEEIS